MDPRTPVLVGVGTSTADDEPACLMADAIRAAASDATKRSLLPAIDLIAVPQGTWSYPDPARLIATEIGADRAVTLLAQIGVSQQTVLSEAMRAITAGEHDVVAVVGGEARAWARRASEAGAGAAETPQPGGTPDVELRRDPQFIAEAEIAVGLVQPVEQYAIIENALRRTEGISIERHRSEIAELWARFNSVAADNPRAAFPQKRTAAAIADPSSDNRPLAFPYNKWHASQWTVNQASALILSSVETARAHGIPRDRWIFPLVGVDATHAVSLSRRRGLHRWPAMQVLGRAASDRIGRPLADVDLMEVYSCFPSAVRVQQRELGLPLDGTPTMTGGMPFAGGPFNNFVYQATAAMVPALRDGHGSLGMITTVCGLLTTPGIAVWSTEPDRRPPLLEDRASTAAEETASVELATDHHGPATVASYTVTYRHLDPTEVKIVADTPDGRRCVAHAVDPALAAEAVRSELSGETVLVHGATFSP